MTDDKQDFKKNLPGGFVWFLMAAFMLALMTQNLIDTKKAEVSFSYQVEHLVNLELIQLEESRKTSSNDNLATFSGKFRDRLTDDSKERFKYLELLDESQDLKSEKERLANELNTEKERVNEAADWFLHLSGMQIPTQGYQVVEGVTGQSLVIHSLQGRNIANLPAMKQQLAAAQNSQSSESLNQLGNALGQMIRNFRSTNLGIGNESMKNVLRNLDQNVTQANSGNLSVQNRLKAYGQAVQELEGIVVQLDRPENDVRLSQLRSVRNYKVTADELTQLNVKVEENEAQLEKARRSVSDVIWFFNNQELSTRTLEQQDSEKFNHWFVNARKEWENFATNKGGWFKAPQQPLTTALEKTFKSEEPAPNYISYLFTFMPVLLVLMVLYFLFSRQMKGVGSGAMNFGKSPAKLMTSDKNKVTFKEVAGIEEVTEELQEIVDFLKSPLKFTALGGHIPKGVLLIGPPGTGKTLVAKAVAGEADRPFFSISGSDFVEMFVGVGASRIRDMFEQAKKQAPCIIFIDEIDAVGRHRGAGIGGGHDEREQTLNQLLVEMDGFDTNEGVILMAATNRPDVLDKALLRPGRFDRRVMISLPDIKGRFEILKVHARKIKMDPSVDLMTIARSTPGSSGADLMNLLNEAALLAARKGRTAVTAQDTAEARDKVLFGKERRSLELDENEKLTTAYHESGHTIVGLTVENSDPVDKVTIIPRGFSLGATMFLPKKNRLSYWKKELIDQLAVLMGGRVAEEIFVKDISSGAKQDLEQATQLARSMVCEWGMSDNLGPVAYEEKSHSGQYLGMGGHSEKKYSEETARAIDVEVRKLLDEALSRAREIIRKNSEAVELLTQMLLEFETLDSTDIQEIYDGKWDIEQKRNRLKAEDELHKKKPATPPPPPAKTVEDAKPNEEPPPTSLSHDLRA